MNKMKRRAVISCGLVCATFAFVCAGSWAATQGPLFPSSVVNTPAGGSATPWTLPGNAASSDDVRATGGGLSTDFLDATGFGFSIPSGATIDGIEIFVEGFALTGPDAIFAVSLKAGSPSPATASAAFPTGPPDTITSMGGPTSLFGDTFTPADINAGTFGARIQVSDPFIGSWEADSISVTVHFTPVMPAATPWGLIGTSTLLTLAGAAILLRVKARRTIS